MILPSKFAIVRMLYAMALARNLDGSWSSGEEIARWFLDAAALLEKELPDRWNT